MPSAIDDLDTIQLNQSNKGEYLRNPIAGSQQSTMQIGYSSFKGRGYFLLTDTKEGEKAGEGKEKEVEKREPKSGNENDNDKPFFLTSWLTDVFGSNTPTNDS